MRIISASEAKKAYFMSGKATIEIYFFLASRIEIKWHIHDKKIGFHFISFNFKCDRFFL